MPARLLIYARWIALAVLVLAIVLIIARWKLPMREQRAGSRSWLNFWEDAWYAWRQRRREATARARNLRKLRGRNVLLVGLHDKALRATQWRLQGLGCTVQSARTGQRALAAIETKAPDAIISDALLPDISAEDLLDSLGEIRPAVVFVGATGTQREGLCQRGDHVACVEESSDPEDIAALVGRMLAESEHLTDDIR